MGRAPISSSAAAAQASTISAAAKVHPDFPTEDASDGCPGGWYRSRFIDSLMPYLRRRDQHGGRVPNMILDRSDDDLIFELVQYAEDQEERYQMHREEVMNG